MKKKFLFWCLTASLLWGSFLFFCGVLKNIAFAKTCVSSLSYIYKGYSLGFLGALKGSILGAIDAFLGGAILLFFFELITKKGLET